MSKNKSKIKREHVIPGKVIVVKPGHTLNLDAHLFLFGKSKSISAGNQLIIGTIPRKIDGINLVQVLYSENNVSTTAHEVFYCDILKHCEII